MTRLKRYLAEICIFLTLLVCYSYFFPRWADWNQNSRMRLTMAIGDTTSAMMVARSGEWQVT
jgi:hypothetical protein